MLDQHGCLVGVPTYILAGELALGQPLVGQLPPATFSDALAAAASGYWHGRAQVPLMFADIYAHTGEGVGCLGMLASAILCAAPSDLAKRHEWVLNEKRLVERAGLRRTAALVTTGTDRCSSWPARVARVSADLGIEPLRPR